MDFVTKKKLGGGINRLKHHLAGMKGDTDACTKVPANVRFKFMQTLKKLRARSEKIFS